ncbi:hypothetical protein [Paenibacillus protaetiae]|uniref:Uncharacterized protein n=1 Tax=Paenibacillus protaetiae TaxID=2509456 RepID=A0A4P6F222_9BACL|nr:hypothetical protein [Paenibacillus protaetiae]QAY67117.1 hypothetical protein ET464_12630 [Paenibacillus protaetiae]
MKVGVFESNEDGLKRFREVWDSFQIWWVNHGESMVAKLTDDTTIVIYNRIIEKYKNENKTPPNGNFAILVTYDQLPKGVEIANDFFIIESLDKLMTQAAIDEVVSRLYSLLLRSL